MTGILRQVTTLIAQFCCFENEFKKNLSFMQEFHQYLQNKQNITWPLGDTNFIFSCSSERYFQHGKIKFVPPSGHVISFISSLKYLSPACNLQIICATYYMLKHGMMCIYSIFKANPFSYIILSTKNAVKFFKPFCCLLLLSGSSHPLVSTIEVKLGELLKQLQKWRKEGE